MTIQTQPPNPDGSSQVVMFFLGLDMFSSYLYGVPTQQAAWRRTGINILKPDQNET